MSMAIVEQDFFNKLLSDKMSVTVFLQCGVKLQGVITDIDDVSLLLRRDGHTQLVYKHAVSTIMPVDVVSLKENKHE